MSGCRMSPMDLVDLLVMKIAKRRRGHLQADEHHRFYEDFFTDLDERVLSSGEDPRKADRLGAVRQAISTHMPSGTLLDVGCGCGDNLLSLSTLVGLELHGVEYASSTAARARKLLGPLATIVEGSATALPFADGTMGAVTCVEVLEHIPEDQTALREIHRVLKQGGVFALTLPYRHWFKAYRDLMGHERHYRRSELVNRLESMGFNVLHYMPNHPHWHRASDYAFTLCRALGILGRRIGLEGDPHRLKIPITQKPLLAWLNDRIVWLQHLENRLDYPTRETSTWILLRKK